MKFFPYVFKSLFRKKTRSLLTLGSILLPLFVVCLFGTLIRTLDRPPTGAGMYRLVVRHKVSLSNWIPEAYRARIQQLPGVEEMSVWCWFGGKYVDYTPKNFFARFGVEPEKLLKIFDEARIVEGSAADWVNDRSGAMVGTELVKRYGWKLGPEGRPAGRHLPGEPRAHDPRDLRRPGREQRSPLLQLGLRRGGAPAGQGAHRDVLHPGEGRRGRRRASRSRSTRCSTTRTRPTKTETEKEFQNGFVQMLGNVKLMLNGISSAIVFVILLIAANTMAMAARERVNEIAVLRTLGFQKETILALILAESLLLALLGGALGLGLFALGFGRLQGPLS